MTYSLYVCPDSSSLDMSLTASEYRLLGDLLLDHISTDPVQKDSLEYLAQRLFVLAVQADHVAAEAASNQSQVPNRFS